MWCCENEISRSACDILRPLLIRHPRDFYYSFVFVYYINLYLYSIRSRWNRKLLFASFSLLFFFFPFSYKPCITARKIKSICPHGSVPLRRWSLILARWLPNNIVTYSQKVWHTVFLCAWLLRVDQFSSFFKVNENQIRILRKQKLFLGQWKLMSTIYAIIWRRTTNNQLNQRFTCIFYLN